MPSIWQKQGDGWETLAPKDYADEATLHTLVEEAPHLLPLAGEPDLMVVGREVQLGAGYADLVAIEPSGRLVVMEVKLSRNPEAKRAVVAQLLSYAALLHKMEIETLEASVLGVHLRKRGLASLAEAAGSMDQEGSFDPGAFRDTLAENLQLGAFRLVFILDEAPVELIRTASYLEAVAEQLTIDLVTVSTYGVGQEEILVPQRVEPERTRPGIAPATTEKGGSGVLVSGAEDFLASIELAPEEDQTELRRLTNWALSLEAEGLCRLYTYHGTSGRLTLLPRLGGPNVGICTVWNEGGKSSISLWRSVIEREAPNSLEEIEQLSQPVGLGQGKVILNPGDELLEAVREAYREAIGK